MKYTIKDEFKNLEAFIIDENYPVVIMGDELYWIANEEPPEEFEYEEVSEVESGTVPAIRRNIQVLIPNENLHTISPNSKCVWDLGRFTNNSGTSSDLDSPDNPYNTNASVEVSGYYTSGDGGGGLFNWNSNNTDFYFPDNSNIRIYKKILSSNAPDDFKFFIHKGKNKYCIYNSCDLCDNKCEVELEEIETNGHPYTMAVIDISAQEPVIVSMFSGEPVFLQTFRNRHLRELDLLKYMDVIYKSHFSADPDIIHSYKYWEWIDINFHNNFDKLIRFNILTEEVNKGNLKFKDELFSLYNEFIESMNQHINSEQNT